MTECDVCVRVYPVLSCTCCVHGFRRRTVTELNFPFGFTLLDVSVEDQHLARLTDPREKALWAERYNLLRREYAARDSITDGRED